MFSQNLGLPFKLRQWLKYLEYFLNLYSFNKINNTKKNNNNNNKNNS